MNCRHIILATLSSLCLAACNNEAKFSVSTSESVDTNIYHTTPLGDAFSYMSADTLRVYAGGGKTVFRAEFDSPLPVYLRTDDGRSCYIIAEKGGEYEILLDKDKISIQGKKAQTLYNALPAPAFITQEAQKHRSITSARNLMELTGSMLQRELQPLDSLRQRAELSRAAYNHIRMEREIFWRAVRANVAYLHFTDKGELDEEDKKMWKSAFDGLNMADKALCRTLWFFELAESYAEYLMFTSPDMDMSELLRQASEGKLNTLYYNIYTEKFKGHNLEYISARKLYNAALQRNYEKELIEIYADFSKRFPDSPYHRPLRPMIGEIEEYHNASRSNEKVTILDNYLSINSFDELIGKFQGKKLYIDIWATWCGPCKDEFKHNEKLRKLLEEEGYELLYISIDDDKRARNWEQMIFAYDLEGSHIRAGEQLHKQLFEIYGSQRLSIPWYMIVNENGEIKDLHAPRPGRLRSENLK